MAKMPTEKVTVERIKYDVILKALRKGPVVYECSFSQAKVLNTHLRVQLGLGLSMKAFAHDLDMNVLSYRFALCEVKKRKPKES